jgi:CRISPR-associated protein Cmr4
VFGPEHVTKNVFQGSLSVNDAFLLCLPVRSYFATFAWLTSPFLLRRYQRALSMRESDVIQDSAACLVTTTSRLSFKGKIYLEDFDLDATETANYWADRIAAAVFPKETDDQKMFRERFAIVPDDVLAHCAQFCLDVRARVRIDPETGTAAMNMLWYEEALPAETIAWGLMTTSPTRQASASRVSADNLMTWLEDRLAPADGRGETLLQIGGGTTIGRGLTRLVIG